jgi:hypothetical protein
MPGKKIFEINFELKELKIEQENIIEKLYSKVEQLIKENQLIKAELKNKDYEIENLKNNYKCLKEENLEIKNRLQIVENLLSTNQNTFFCESKIIKNNNEKNKLIEWISINGKIKEINLLYKATTDGDDGHTFYSKCVNKGPTISLIKTKNGRRFGGFASAEWENKKQILEDSKAFLFSLDNIKKYNILQKQLAIGCDPFNYFLIYGNNLDGKGLYLFSGFLKKESREDHSTKVYDVSSAHCLSGELDFHTEEVEVYQIVFQK